MTGALIILLVTVAVGLVLYVYDLKYKRTHASEETPELQETPGDSHGEICCGKHLVCEKPLSPKPGEEIVYYDDEELDRFAGRDAEAYSPDEIEEIREVMTTLRGEDVAGWVRSLHLRGINIPVSLRDELFILLEC